MFTDLVDSTGIRVRIGEEEADRLRERHDRLVRAAVVAHSGRIAKHTGDGVMAVFFGASDAISAAVSVQQDIDADNRRDGASSELLEVRIGISTGDVTVDGDDCFGLPVVEAQRLESAAQPGQILISSLVSALARGRGGHELLPVGSFELKGLDAPLDVQEVRWSPLPIETSELPSGLADRGSFPFAGRNKEADILADAWIAAAAGTTRLVLIAGEPGIGKTRLAAETAGTVLGKGGVVLAGRCDELVGAPYQPWTDALRTQIGRPGGTDRLGPAAGELTRLYRELSEVLPDLPAPLVAGPEAERLRLFEAVRGWLADLSSAHPILLVLDDLHWADTATLLLLRHVVVTDPVPNLLVIGTYRDTDLDRSHPLAGMLGELRRRSEVTRIMLDGLDAGEVTDLMTRAAGHELETEGMSLAVAVQAETGGNPFFVGEVLRHLAESGSIVYSEGRWISGQAADDLLLPEGIREVVGRRLSVLPEQTQATLTLAAVVGVDFDLDVLAKVAGSGEDALIDAIEPALTAQLLIETGVGRYRFSHALVRSALQGELSTTRRARVHRSAAEAIESLRVDHLDNFATELAYHWAEAGSATAHDQAITYARRAAELAWARTAPEEAARWYRQARELLDGGDAQLDAELAVSQTQAEILSGTPGWQQTMHEAARAAERLGNARLMASALCLTNRNLIIEESPEPADRQKIALLERALELARGEPALTAELSGALALELVFTGDIERRVELVTASETYADTLVDPIERQRILKLAVLAPSFRDITRERIEHAAELSRAVAEKAKQIGAFEEQGDALWGLFYGTMWLGQPERAQILTECSELLDVYPHPILADHLLLLRMCAALIDGHIDQADRLADEVARQGIAHGRELETTIYSNSGHLQAARERFGLGPMVDLMRTLPVGDATANKPNAGRGLLTLALAEGGQVTEATALLERYGSKDFENLPDDPGLPVARSAFADAAAITGHERSCDHLYRHMLTAADLHQATGGFYLGATARYLGNLADALGRLDEADEWFARARSEHEFMCTPPWLARGLLDWAESLERRGQHDRATALAIDALAAIGDLDLAVSRERAERFRLG